MIVVMMVFLQFFAGKTFAQDNYAVEFNVGLLHNTSLYLGDFKNTGGGLGVNYFFDRNIFAGINGTFLLAVNPVTFQPYSFNAAVSFTDKMIVINENMSRLQVGAIAGYRFFPLRFLSIDAGFQLNYLSLNRTFKESIPVNTAGTAWMEQTYGSASVITPGAFLNINLNVGKKTSLFLGIQSSDITNSLFEAKDASIVEFVNVADNNIAGITERANAYNPLDIRIGVVFKFANRKF